MSVDLALLGTLAAVTLTVALSVASSRWGFRPTLLFAALVAYVLPQTQLPVPMDSRYLGAALTVALFAIDRSKKGGRTTKTSLVATAPFAYLLLSASWTSGSSTDTLAQAAFILVLLLCMAVKFTGRELQSALRALTVTLLLIGLFQFATGPAEIWLGGRLRGPFVSANSLALFCALVFPAAVGRSKLALFAFSPITLGIIWFTGSRAALLAFAIQLVVITFGRLNSTGKAISLISLGAAAWYLVPGIMAAAASQGAGSESILRSNNSRESVWQDSLFRIADAPWIGTGIGSLTSDFETGSSALSILILGGAVGLTITGIVLAAGLFRGIRRVGWGDWRIALLLGTLVNSVFEGWLMAAGTAYSLIFWTVFSQTASTSEGLNKPTEGTGDKTALTSSRNPHLRDGNFR